MHRRTRGGKPAPPSKGAAENRAILAAWPTELLWLADPETVTAYRPGEAPSLHRVPAKADARPVLLSFELDLAALFAVIHAGNDE